VYWLPVLHGGLRVQSAKVRMALTESAGPQVHHVPGPRACRQADGMCRDLSDRATKFGERDDLIKEAQDRIRQNPSTYLPRIYGLNEVGGTSVLILSSTKVEEYGYPASEKIGDTPMPEYTGRVMERIPDFIPVWTLVLGGIYWVSHRREEVAAAEAQEKEKKNGSAR